MARTWGLPEFRFLEMPHPIANLTRRGARSARKAIVPEVVKLLLEGQKA